MGNVLKEKKKELLEVAMEKNPDVAVGKKIVGAVALIWFAIRLLLEVAEIGCAVSIDGFTVSPMNIVMLVVIGLFVWVIYQGNRAMCVLPIIGGVMMVAQTFLLSLYSVLGPDYYMIARLYSLLFIIAAYGQVLLMVFLLADKKCRAYFDTALSINKELQEERRNLKK